MYSMARFLAETPRDQEEIERLKREIEEYKKRHPSTIDIKNGKA